MPSSPVHKLSDIRLSASIESQKPAPQSEKKLPFDSQSKFSGFMKQNQPKRAELLDRDKLMKKATIQT